MQNHRLVELAIKGLEAERARIDQEISQLRKRLAPVNNPQPSIKPKRKMSAAARKKISEAMKRRYAALSAAKK